MITVRDAKLSGVRIIEIQSFEDHRGRYVETYNEALYRNAGIDVTFVQDDFSVSSHQVLRGLHGDAKTWKLISCPVGKLMLAVVNYLAGSSQFLQWETFILSDRAPRQILVPPSFANGHLVLSESAMFSYKQSQYYEPETQFSLRWDDPAIGIWWPIRDPILSPRDASSALLKLPDHKVPLG